MPVARSEQDNTSSLAKSLAKEIELHFNHLIRAVHVLSLA
jgi:hypothetical protein